ncbi:MAG: hypothetical protein GY867_09685 [bacterium]|nr:hypothetical protein [bacterium]
MKTSLTAVLFTALLIWSGCSSGADSSGADSSEAAAKVQQPDGAAVAAVELGGSPVSLAGIVFTPPTAWKDMGPGGMRKAAYAFGPVGEDADSATVTAFYFGPSGGGGIQANIDRWIGQMTLPADADPATAITREEETVNGMTLHTVQLPGTYSSSMGGPMMGGSKTAKEGYLMTAVVLEAPEGNVFFKMTGPRQTASEMNTGFKAMLAGVEKTDGSL